MISIFSGLRIDSFIPAAEPGAVNNPSQGTAPSTQTNDPNSVNITTPPTLQNRILNDKETYAFIVRVLGRPVQLTGEQIANLVSTANYIADRNSSRFLTPITAQKILRDPTLKDTMRVAFNEILSDVNLDTPPQAQPAVPTAEPLDSLTALAAADKALDPGLLEKFQSGIFHLSVKFTSDKGKTTGFRLILHSRWHQETIAEFRDGKITKSPEGPLAKGSVTYLQRLLVLSGYLNLKNFTFGVFCRETLNALYIFMSNKNLTAAFNLDAAVFTFNAVSKEAELAFAQMQAIKGNDVVNRATRYEQAKKALGKILGAIRIANRYVDIPEDKLSEKEKELVKACRDSLPKLREKANEIFKQIFEIKNKEVVGLFDLDRLTIDKLVKKYGKQKALFLRYKALYERNPSGRTDDGNTYKSLYVFYKKKYAESFSEVLNSVNDLYGTLWQWLDSLQHDPKLYAIVKGGIKDAVDTIRDHNKTFPEINRYIDRQFMLLDQKILSGLEGTAELGKDPRALHERAARYLDVTLGGGSAFGSHPARATILAIIQNYVKQGKSLSSLKYHLSLLSILNTHRSDAVSRLAMHYIRNNRRVSVQGETGSYEADENVSQDIQDTMVSGTHRFSDVPSASQNKVFNLAFMLYSFMETHNNHAKANGQPGLKLEDLISGTREIIDRVEGKVRDSRLKGFGVSAERLLAALEKKGYINKDGIINANVKIKKEELDLGLGLKPEEQEKIFNLLSEAQTLQMSGQGQEKEIGDTFGLLLKTSSDPQVAKYEISEQLNAALNKRGLVSFRQLMGGNELVISPKIIRELETAARKTSTLQGKISFEYLKKLAPQYLKGIDAKAGDWFFVTHLGIFKIPKGFKDIDKVPTISPYGKAGIEVKRDFTDFVNTEPLACIKLAISRQGAVSDAEELTMRGRVSARLAATDLDMIVKVFSEGKFWLMTQAVSFLPLETSGLTTVANIIAAKEPSSKLPDLLRRAASGRADTRFTQEEKKELEKFLKDFKPSAYTHLEPLEQRSIASAVSKLKKAVSEFYHKNGMSADEVKVLQETANYLRWDSSLSLNDARLTRKPEFVKALKEKLAALAKEKGKSFDADRFEKMYNATLDILKTLHGDLKLLASKYPPEEAGWNGSNFKGWIDFLKKHYERIAKAAGESVVAPSQESFFMTGIPNDMIVKLRFLLLKDKITPELTRINKTLADIEARIKRELIQVKEGQKDTIPLAHAAKAFVDLHKAFEPLLKELGEKNKTLGDESMAKRYVRAFLNIAEQMVESNKEPSSYITQADSLLQTVQILLTQVKEALVTEKGSTEKGLLVKIEAGLQAMSGKLEALVNLRDKTMPVFAERSRLEADRQEILSKLTNDRFTLEELKLLRKMFADKLDKNEFDLDSGLAENLSTAGIKLMDAAGRVLSGQTKHVTGSGGVTTKKTVGEILDETIAYLEKNPEAEINLSSSVHALENRVLVRFKCAMAKFVGDLAREQNLSIPKAVSGLFFGHGSSSFWLAVPAIASRAAGGAGEVTIGPSNYAELLAVTNSSYGNLKYSALSFLALASSGERAKMNLSPQIYMLMNSTQEGQKILAETLTRTGKTFNLDEVNREVVTAFLKYIKDDILPKLEGSPRMRARLAYLISTNKVFVDLTQYIGKDNDKKLDAEFLKGVPQKGTFKIYDSFHANERVTLSKLLETAMALAGEMNQSRALQEPENYALSYFDPMQSLRDIHMKYSLDTSREQKPPKTISVLRYGADPESGNIRNAYTLADIKRLPAIGKVFEYLGKVPLIGDVGGYLGKIPLETLLTIDVPDWANLYGKKFLYGLIDNITNDFPEFLSDMAVEGGSFFVQFVKLMGPQIRMGLTNTFGGLGDLARAGASGDKQKALAAVDRISEGVAHTAGGFLVFEVFPAVFYKDVKDAIEAGDYNKALAKALAITAMFAKTLRVTIDVLAYLHAKGEVTYIKGKGLFIKDPAKAAALYEEIAKKEQTLKFLRQRSVAGKLGIKLINYSFNPFAYVALYRSARTYASGGLTVNVKRSSVQLQLESKATENPSTWRKIADFANENIPGRKYRQHLRWRQMTHFWGLASNLEGLSASNRPGVKLDGRTASIISNVLGDPNRTVKIGGEEVKSADLSDLLQKVAQEIKEGKAKPEVLDTKIEVKPGETITLRDLFHYQESQAALKQAWENPKDYFDLEYSKPAAGGKELGKLTLRGETYQKLVEARNNADYAAFKKIIKDHGLIGGEGLTGASIKQLWNAFDAPANVYQEVKGELVNVSAESAAKTPTSFELLQQATIGKGFGDSYTLNITDPKTGEPIVDPRTGKSYKVTGRQIMEVLYNAFVKPKSKCVISEQVDQLIREHFSKTVPMKDLHAMVKKAGGRYIRGLAGHKYAGSLYVRGKVKGANGYFRNWALRGWRWLVGNKFGDPMYKSWKQLYKQLEGSPIVDAYATHLSARFGRLIDLRTARRILAQKLYDNYVTKYTSSVMEALDVAAKQVLTPEEYRSYEAKGALDKRRIFGDRLFQKVYKSQAFKEQLGIQLAVTNNEAENLVKETEAVFKEEGIRNTHLACDTMAERVSIEGAKIVKTKGGQYAIQDAKTGKKFGELVFEEKAGGWSLRYKLKDPNALDLSVEEKTSFSKVQEAAYVEKVKDLARTLNISESKIAEFNSVNDVLKAVRKADLALAEQISQESGKVLKNIGELVRQYKAGEIKDPQLKAKMKKFIAWMNRHANHSRNQMLAAGGRSLIIGFVTILGVEKVADMLEIKDPMLRLAFVLGPTHVISHSAQTLLTPDGAKEAWQSLSSFTRTLINPPAELKTVLGSVPRLKFVVANLATVKWAGGAGNMIKGIGQGIVISQAFNKLLDILGAGQNSTWRNSVIQLGSTFAIQSAISIGYQIAMKKAAASLLASGVAATEEQAAKMAAGSRLGIAGRLLGPVATGIGLVNLVDNLGWSPGGKFETVIRQEAYKAVMNKLYTKDTSGTWVLGKVGHFLAPNKVEGQTMDTPIAMQVIDKFRKQSNDLRAGLRAQFQSQLAQNVYAKYDGGDASPAFYANISIDENGADIIDNENYGKYVEGYVLSGTPSGLNAKAVKDTQKAIAFLHFADFSEVEFVRSNDPSNNNDIRKMFNDNGTLKSVREDGERCLKNPKPTAAARKAFFNWITSDPKVRQRILALRQRVRIAYLLKNPGQGTAVDRKLGFIGADGKVNIQHPQAIALQRDNTRIIFAKMQDDERAALIEQMFVAVYLTDAPQAGSPDQLKVAAMKQQLEWIGYSMNAETEKSLQPLKKELDEVGNKLENTGLSEEDKAGFIARLAHVKDRIGRIIAEFAGKENNIILGTKKRFEKA